MSLFAKNPNFDDQSDEYFEEKSKKFSNNEENLDFELHFGYEIILSDLIGGEKKGLEVFLKNLVDLNKIIIIILFDENLF